MAYASTRGMVKRYLASYTVRAGSRVETFFLRPEGTENTRESATRFRLHIDANLALARIRDAGPVANYSIIGFDIETVWE